MEAVGATTRLELKNILFTTDFSESSEAALPFALAFARHYESTLCLAHVNRPESYPLVPPEAIVVPFEESFEYSQEEMDYLAARLGNVPHRILVDRGEIREVVPEMIVKNRIDWVVLGTHGRTGLRKLLMGSVAEQILRLSPVPVLSVGPRVYRKPTGDLDLHNIVCAVPCLPGSEHPVAYAFSLAQEHQAHLTLLHVVEPVAPVQPREQWNFGRTLELLAEMVPPGADLWCEPELKVEMGDPADELLAMARGRGVGLIVESKGAAHSRTRAVAYRVASQAHCPVLTVP